RPAAPAPNVAAAVEDELESRVVSPVKRSTPRKDDELDDDELEDDELEGDDEDEEGEEGDEIEADAEDDDDDFDDDDDDDDDDLDDDDEDDDDDLDDDEDDDYEVIDKTAAELAEEGIEGPGEITVLARKRQPKQPKQRPQRPVDTPSASAAEARRRRRRRRRKRRAMLPPKSAFTTPVLSTAAPSPEGMPRRMGRDAGGPVIEYVRGPMRIASAPVASANPNDAGVGNRRNKKGRRGWDRGPDRRDNRGPRPERPAGDPNRAWTQPA